MDQRNKLTLISGNSNLSLSEKIAHELGVSLCERTLSRFSDGEIRCVLKEDVRDTDVYVVQSTSNPVDEHLMECLVLIDTLRRASASRITAVIPYFGYARQDRKDSDGVPITARLVANLLEAAGVDRILTVHLHSEQIEGFFNIPVDHLHATETLYEALDNHTREYVVVSADTGGVKRSRVFADLLGGAPLAILDKRRHGPGESEVMNIVGDVVGKDCLIVEDMIDTGDTLCNAVESLIQAGACSVTVCATHAVLSGKAKEKLARTGIVRMITTDSIYHSEFSLPKQFTVVSLSKSIAETITRVHNGMYIQK